jgi:hypothetical protein
MRNTEEADANRGEGIAAGGSGPRVRDLMRALDGCIAENTALDVVEIMDEMDLAFMPVVADAATRRVVGVVSRGGLENAIQALGAVRATVRAAPLLEMPILQAETGADAVEEVAGRAPAYIVVEQGRLIGIYRGSRRSRPWSSHVRHHQPSGRRQDDADREASALRRSDSPRGIGEGAASPSRGSSG